MALRAGLELLRVADDLLDHAHDAAGPGRLLVLLEPDSLPCRARAGRTLGTHNFWGKLL